MDSKRKGFSDLMDIIKQQQGQILTHRLSNTKFRQPLRRLRISDPMRESIETFSSAFSLKAKKSGSAWGFVGIPPSAFSLKAKKSGSAWELVKIPPSAFSLKAKKSGSAWGFVEIPPSAFSSKTKKDGAAKTIQFGSVTVPAQESNNIGTKRNIEASQIALAGAMKQIIKPGIEISAVKNVPLYYSDPERPDLIIRNRNGKIASGIFQNGKFKPCR
jgi:hypothetical protein